MSWHKDTKKNLTDKKKVTINAVLFHKTHAPP